MEIMMKCFIFWKRVLKVFFLHAWLEGSFVVKACFIGLLSSPLFVCRYKTSKGSQDVKSVSLLNQELAHAVVVCMPAFVNSCCWQLFKQVQMKVLWSICSSHLFEPPWIKDQGKEVQTTFCKLHSRSSAWSQGGKQFFPRQPTHTRREVVRYCGSEALCKGKCREAERRGCCYSHYCSD